MMTTTIVSTFAFSSPGVIGAPLSAASHRVDHENWRHGSAGLALPDRGSKKPVASERRASEVRHGGAWHDDGTDAGVLDLVGAIVPEVGRDGRDLDLAREALRMHGRLDAPSFATRLSGRVSELAVRGSVVAVVTSTSCTLVVGFPKARVTWSSTRVFVEGAIVACPAFETGPSGRVALGGATAILGDPTTLQRRSTGSPAQMCRGTAENAFTSAPQPARHATTAHARAARTKRQRGLLIRPALRRGRYYGAHPAC